MTSHIALLRAINLGSHNSVPTADLREFLTRLGRNAFPKEAKGDPAHLVAMFLKDAPDAKDVKALQAAITGREVVRAVGNQLYVTYPDGIGRSRVTNAVIEKHLGTRSTGRNWNTVLTLAALT